MPDVMSELRPLVARVTRRPVADITPDSRFSGLGSWGSLAAMRLLAAIEQPYGVQLDLRTYMKVETVGELAGQLSRHVAAGSGTYLAGTPGQTPNPR